MKKSEKAAIRRKVESAAKKHVADAVDSYARGKAYDKVSEAMRDEPESVEDKSMGAPAPAPSGPMTPASMMMARSSRK